MKKISVFLLVLSLLSCSDGDFDIPAFDFTENISSCGEYVLYRTNTDNTEVLVLTITPIQLVKELGEKTYPVSGDISVTYRVFEEGIGSNYFCQDIPPTSPNIIKELNANNSATVHINYSESVSGTSTVVDNFEIKISNLKLSDESEDVYFETFEFGTFSVSN